MRLFAAIRLSPAVRSALAETARTLGRQGRGALTPPENLHVTLAFIGETDRLEAAREAVEAACAAAGPFPLTVAGLGRFGDLLWAGVEENLRLERLALAVQEELRREGFSIERRPWRPHVTLARRWRGPAPALTAPRTRMEVRRVSVMESIQADGRVRYRELFGVTL